MRVDPNEHDRPIQTDEGAAYLESTKDLSPTARYLLDNTAIWLPAKCAPLEVAPAPYSRPHDNEIVIRNRAVAINPVDWLAQSIGGFVFPWLKYPFVLGSDVAGEVVEVGSGITRFKPGDRVVGHAVGTHKSRNNPAEGGFQIYTVLLEHMASPIPDGLTFERAAVLPLGLSTAACALFEKGQLGLQHPSSRPRATGKSVLIWGGSTSVGSNAIQLAVAAGYDVIATASPKNFGYVKNLGASMAFDYRSKTVVDDIIKALEGRRLAGAIAIGQGSTFACLDIVGRCIGEKVIAMATPPVSFDGAPLAGGRLAWLLRTMAKLVFANVSIMVKARRRGIRTRFIFGSTLVDNEVGPMIYSEFLPLALSEGRYIAAPDPCVAGHGLGAIPAAIALQKQGVSASKLVVTL